MKGKKYINTLFNNKGVEFGARMITIDGKQIKLQIWDTVSFVIYFFQINFIISI